MFDTGQQLMRQAYDVRTHMSVRFATPAAVLLLVLLTPSCRQARPAPAEFRDAIPLPEEPLVTQAESVGRYGGRFVIPETTAPRTFNAMMASETNTTALTDRMFIGLVDFDKTTQEIVPMLAKSWERASDGLTWTFHLRRGASFSDGHPLTSDDVVFSFTVAYDSALHPPIQDGMKMEGQNWTVTAPDSYTVVLKTPKPNALLLTLAAAVPILPKHVLQEPFQSGRFAAAYGVDTDPSKVVTSGPWRLRQYAAGEKTVLARNPYWFGVDQRKQRLPYLDELVYLVVSDAEAADLKFRSREVDGLVGLLPQSYPWYQEHQREGDFTLYDLGPSLSSTHFWFNLNPVRKPSPGKTLGEPAVGRTKYAWFSNPVFRRAVSMAIDRDAMIHSIFGGNGVKAWSITTVGDKVWYNPHVIAYDYNPAEARRLLAGLGWKDSNGDGVIEDAKGNPVRFALETNSNATTRVAMANFIKDDLAKLGIAVTLSAIDFNTLVTHYRNDFHYDAALSGLVSGLPTDPGLAQNVWRSSGISHRWNVRQPVPETPEEARIDGLMDRLISEPDLGRRKDIWTDIENIVNEQSWIIWLPSAILKVPVRNRFGNMHPTVFDNQLLRGIEQVYLKPQPSV